MAEHGKHVTYHRKARDFEPIRTKAPAVGKRITPQNNPRISTRAPNNKREVPVA